MVNRKEVLEYYCRLCLSEGKILTRDAYASLHPLYSIHKIVVEWGNWGNFVSECFSFIDTPKDEEKPLDLTTISDKKIVIVSSVFSGEYYSHTVLELLKGMAKHLNADLRLLQVNSSKKKEFTEEQLEELRPYLIQELTFKLDEYAICKSVDQKFTCKRPLTNVEKISQGYNLYVISSAKQQCKILPYDTNESFRIAYTTGTISSFEYKNTLTACVDKAFNKCGAIVLEYDVTTERYLPRNIEIVNNEIYDGDTIYCFENNEFVAKKTSVDAIVLGDLHLPEESTDAVVKSIFQIDKYKPKQVFIGDWCSFNSINHHDATHYLNKVMYCQQSLESELAESVAKLNSYVENTSNCEFVIIHSNHDEFLDKWLNSGEIEKDKQNAVTGMKLYLSYVEKSNPYYMFNVNDRVKFLKKGEMVSVNGVVLSNHGHVGLCGAKGNSSTYVKTYSKSVTGHTHSPKIEDSNYTVGTCSKLNLNYTTHLTNWAFANAIVHKNGAVQLIF